MFVFDTMKCMVFRDTLKFGGFSKEKLGHIYMSLVTQYWFICQSQTMNLRTALQLTATLKTGLFVRYISKLDDLNQSL